MSNKKSKKVINPWKAEAWELRDWLCEKAEEEYGKLNMKEYFRAICRKSSQILKQYKAKKNKIVA